MGEHHALRCPGGARGVNQDRYLFRAIGLNRFGVGILIERGYADAEEGPTFRTFAPQREACAAASGETSAVKKALRAPL